MLSDVVVSCSSEAIDLFVSNITLGTASFPSCSITCRTPFFLVANIKQQ